MHELSIALAIIDAAADEADRQGGATVTAVHLKLGPLSGVVKDALLSAFELAREQSPLEHSRLVIEEVPVVGYCAACEVESAIDSIAMLCCPQCGGPVTTVSGRELEMVALEIEQ
jgi:hydrogenase nickel incorporation protein HypA/HybF